MPGLVSTHIEGLDKVLGGGIPRGSVVLVAGTPGTMKTSLCYSILYNNAGNGARGLFISLEQNAESLAESMRKMGYAGDLGGSLYVIDLGVLRRGFNVREKDQDWVEILLALIRQGMRGNGYDMLVIDSLEALYAVAEMKNPRRELFHLFTELKELGLTTLIIAEAPFGDARLTRYGEDFLADGIIYLRHQEVEDTQIQLRIRVVKMRMMRHDQGYFALLHDGRRFQVTNVLVTH
ncbi:MAG TPA: ATPase domain-containing protein [Thermoplasmata archaeon]|nr:ATPase domain-containing protein [Thermoplasmata archaeon]